MRNRQHFAVQSETLFYTPTLIQEEKGMLDMFSANTMGELIRDFLIIYLILSFALTCYSAIYMYVVKYKANAVKLGKQRIQELIAQGRFKQIPLYSMEEISGKKSLGEVRLSIFPNDTGEKRKYVIVCPGGGYAHCVTGEEGYPIAAKLNEMGYTAFVLEYRTRFHCSAYAPMQDLAQAVRYIEAHREELNVLPENYAICGFSAGGNLAGVFGGHEHGYEKYQVRKPGALLLGYPWTNVNHWLDHPYWNIWKGLIGIWLSERGILYMFGRHANRKNRESLCVQNYITPDYPPTYIMAGSNDILVPASHHAEVLNQALRKQKVKHLYEQYWHLPHGIGLAVGTRAEGWLENAVTFWEESTMSVSPTSSDDMSPSSN